MAIYIMVSCNYNTNLYKDFSAKIVSVQILTDDIQFIVKKILQWFLECSIEMLNIKNAVKRLDLI